MSDTNQRDNEGMDSSFLKGFNIPADDKIKTACVQFENLIAKGSQPDIEKFLQGTDLPSRTNLLTRLILIEVRHRIMKGDTPSIDEYIKRFPDEAETINSLKSYFEHITEELASSSAVTIKAVNDLFKKLSRFELRRDIGSGSYGSVWLAWDSVLKRYVAVKIFDRDGSKDSDTDPVMHEAVCTAQLNHPNIVTLFDHGIEGDYGYLVMEYVPGGDLKKLIGSGKLNIRLAADLCLKIAKALDSAHNGTEQVIHRDIKPSNILLDFNGEPKIGDFGIAKSTAVNKTISKDLKILGTPAYMAPEQVRNTNIGPWSDVYSLGVVLYEMLTGRPPFEGDIRDLIMTIQFRDMPDIRSLRKDVPKDLETICVKATAKLKKDRYQTAGEFANDLQLFLDGKPINAKPLTFYTKMWNKVIKRPLVSLLTVATIGLLCLTCSLAFADTPIPEGKVRMHIKCKLACDDLELYPLDKETGKAILKECVHLRNVSKQAVDLNPGNYLIATRNNMDKPDACFNFFYRFAPDEDVPSVPLAYRNKFYRKIGERRYEWLDFYNLPVTYMNNFTLVDLEPFLKEPEVLQFHLRHNELKGYKFYIYNDILTEEDLKALHVSSGYEIREHRSYSQRILAPYTLALNYAEKSCCRLPYIAEFEMLELYLNMSSKINNTKYTVHGIDDGIHEWTSDMVHANLTDHENKTHDLTGAKYNYFYVYDKVNEKMDYKNDLDYPLNFRFVKDYECKLDLK